MKCLLLELKDKRKFFTHEKNYNQLIEFCNSFKANIAVVNLKSGNVLNLDELAPALCNSKQKKQDYDYVVIENKIISKPSKKLTAKSVKNSIRKQFLSKKTVSLKSLRKKHNGISPSCLCNYMREVKDDLMKDGYSFTKEGVGSYRIS